MRLDAALADGCERVAVLYGGLHMPDLVRRLQDRGLVMTGLQWRTVWSVEVPVSGSPLRLLAFPLLLALDAADWIGTLAEGVQGASQGAAQGVEEISLLVSLYLLRHAFLYYQLSKTALEWNRALFPQAKRV